MKTESHGKKVRGRESVQKERSEKFIQELLCIYIATQNNQ